MAACATLRAALCLPLALKRDWVSDCPDNIFVIKDSDCPDNVFVKQSRTVIALTKMLAVQG